MWTRPGVAERHGFAPPYPSTIVLPDPRSVRGRLLLAVGRTKDGINELEAAEKAAASRGHHNPVHLFWAADLARALATEDPARAARLAVEYRSQAERFGTDTAIGEALRCAAALETGRRAVRLAARAVAYLESSPCQYEHAVARVEYGILARSRTDLERGLALARSCGADGLAARAEAELATATGRARAAGSATAPGPCPDRSRSAVLRRQRTSSPSSVTSLTTVTTEEAQPAHRQRYRPGPARPIRPPTARGTPPRSLSRPSPPGPAACHDGSSGSSASTRWAVANAELAAGTPQYTAVCSRTAPISSGVSPLRRAARTCMASSS
ncbi:hypothetical protein SHIRM173S_12366 [Streptomyces hirsutus]